MSGKTRRRDRSLNAFKPFDAYTGKVNHGFRITGFAAVVVLFIAAVMGLAARHAEEHGSFKAFYCAGQAASQRRDPYRVEPLRSCEKSVAGRWLGPGEVEPAPLPGYALTPYELLSRLPFARAAAVYDALALAATIAVALLLAALTQTPSALILLLLIPLGLLNIAYGEAPIFTTFGIALAGWAASRKRWTAAAVGAAIALVQPHVGFAVLLALMILAPRSRVPAAIVVVLLVALSFATIGLQTNVEYLRSVLPAQALSELAAADQYSLSHVLYLAGAPPQVAIGAGELWTLAMIAAGILGGRAAARRLNAPELIALLPPAAVMLGGVYLHDIQLMAALPAAIVVAARTQLGRWPAAWLALCALAVVWSQRAGASVLLLNLAAVLAASLVGARTGLWRRAGLGALAGILAVAAVVALHAKPEPQIRTAPERPAAATALASDAWAAYLRATPARTTETLAGISSKIPSWLGLATLLIICIVPPLRAPAPGLTAAHAQHHQEP